MFIKTTPWPLIYFIVICCSIPFFNWLTILDALLDKDFRKALWKEWKPSKWFTILIISMLYLPALTAQPKNFELQGTITPSSEAIGVLSSYKRIIIAADIGAPKINYGHIKENMLFSKIGIGFKPIILKRDGITLNTIVTYTHIHKYKGYNIFLSPEKAKGIV